MTSEIKGLRTTFERRKGQQENIVNSIDVQVGKLVVSRKELRYHEKAKEVIKQVGLKTQQQLSYNISEVTTMALHSVLDKPYDLEVEFIERRNKTECDIYFERKGQRIEPFDGGGGAVDIASFALRIASWSMQFPRSRNVLILDEPFKHLKGEETNKRMLEMVQQISKKLGIQIIMVSDERVSRDATVAATDTLFETSISKGKTRIKCIENG